jgi:hypothetical protein
MGRGKTAEVGDTRVSKNGYHYTKTGTGWRLTHHLVAEEKLGRPLNENEIVQFIGSKTNLRPDNVRVIQKRTSSLRKRKAILEERIEEMQAELDSINEQLSMKTLQ